MTDPARLFFVNVILFLAILVTACSSQTGSAERSPDSIVDKAVANMHSLSSFQYEMQFLPDSAAFIVEFAFPDSYRFILLGNSSPVPTTPATGVIEVILAGDRSYGRQCEEIGTGCSPWEEEDRPDLPIFGPSATFSPGWDLLALEIAEGFVSLGTEEIDGNSLLHLGGSVNHIRAILQNLHRISCPNAEQETDTCDEPMFQEELGRNEPTLGFFDRNPTTIDLWVSEDRLVQRIEFKVPPPEPDEEQAIVTFDYSHFNDVVIEPPR